MHISTVVLLVITPSCSSIAEALPASCKPEWKIDWHRQPPDLSNFEPSYPGEIFPGMTFNDVIQFVGLSWNAPSWQEVMGHVCIQYGPLIYALYPEQQIRRECDLLVTSLQEGKNSDIAEMCTSYWNQIDVENAARQLLSGYDECLFNSMQQDVPNSDGSVCDFDPFVTIFATDLLGKTSRVAFGVLEWLGPSPFSGDWYGACSAMRLLLSNRIDQIVNELETRLLRYLVADTLEYLHRVDICGSEDNKVRDVLYLIPISKQDGEYICDFLSGNPSQEEYLQNGAALLQTFLSVPSDGDLCTDVIVFLSSYDPYSAIGYQVTGRNLTSLSNRYQFCREIASAFSGNTQTHTYIFPQNYDINSWYIFAEAGQLLPYFSFLDAVNVIVAFFRSDTLSDGGVVLCNVFESFVSQFEPSVESICTALRGEDTETVEKFCRILSLPVYFHPSLRVPTPWYAAVTGTDMIRKLLNLKVITQYNVCQALDEFFHSENNLQSVTRFDLNVSLSELLPIADSICQDYDSVLDYIEKQTYLDPAEFQQIVQDSTDAILAHLGFSDRETICQSIASGIVSSSGRAKSSLTKDMEDRFLMFLTDPGRCTDSATSLQRLLSTQGFQLDFDRYFYQYTGYKSITSLCENLSVSFAPARCKGKMLVAIC
ncbi:hypothetical protein HOLleu_19798 [Holothuria leucospilota]|uniref:Uncharacterized protein n=1 Tax=Holothuria leucospilota TaxID=206669 RepID=A0A9Q1BYW3_HOLLE|nr:hypothetical protein HOLleu_19798 [Holothuria leucospilota]